MRSSGNDPAGEIVPDGRIDAATAPCPAGRVFLSAGEVSGDRLGGGLARALRAQAPELSLAGCAGPAMRAAGVQAFASSEDFAVQGWEAVVLRLPVLAARVFALRRALSDFSPDLLVLIDSPGLNRPLLATARRRGIPVFWLAPPQLWAWKTRPAPYLRDLPVQSLFGFERDSLVAAGADASWHGVPDLLRPPAPDASESRAPAGSGFVSDDSRGAPSLPLCEFARGRSGAAYLGVGHPAQPRGGPGYGARRTIAVLPGSRPSIRRTHFRFFLREAMEAAGRLGFEVVLVQPDGHDPWAAASACPGVPVVAPAKAFERAALALCVPGTGCLEAALAGVPSVVAACPGGVDRLLARRLLDPGAKALPNRLLGTQVLPEIYGAEARSPGRLAAALVDLHHRRDGVMAALGELRGRLGPRNALERAAETCLRLMKRGSTGIVARAQAR